MDTARRRWLWLGAALVVVLGAVALAVTFLGADTPDVVDAERALQQDRAEAPPADEVEEGPPAPSEAPAADAADLDGRWIVDRDRPFDPAAGTGTFVGYRIDEELSGIGANTAVGRTPEVEGDIELVGTRLVSAEIVADLTALESDDSRRDNQVRRMLGERTAARFVLTDPVELGEIPPVGEVIELPARGTLAIGDVAHDVEVTLEAVVAERGLLVTGSTVIVLDDYDVEVPTVPIVLSAADDAVVEWQLFFVRD
jgi:hypothetical protein